MAAADRERLAAAVHVRRRPVGSVSGKRVGVRCALAGHIRGSRHTDRGCRLRSGAPPHEARSVAGTVLKRSAAARASTACGPFVSRWSTLRCRTSRAAAPGWPRQRGKRVSSARDVALAWQPAPQVVSRRLGDEVVLVDLRSNRIFSLNRTGARVWELLATGHDWQAIRRVLLGEFDVQAEVLELELEALAGSLAAEGFVQKSTVSGPRPDDRANAPRSSFGASAPQAGPWAIASLLVRMGAWSIVLPVLKHLLPLPTLVRLMSRRGGGVRSRGSEEQIVRYARRVYSLRRAGTCLERSLVAYRYLSRANAEPWLVVGVRRDNQVLMGHAWVLVDGSPLYESSASLDPFLPVVEFAPDGHAAG